MTLKTIKPEHRLADLAFPVDFREQIQDLLDDHQYATALQREGLTPRRKLLFHGPSGCGKTALSHALADALKCSIAMVSLSDTVGSHLGETAKNVSQALEFARVNLCVLLMDEFDSVGCARRGETAGARDQSHTVNTLLVELERLQPLGLVIACTNLFSEIDRALLRRFDAILEIPSPTQETLRTIANGIIRGRFSIDVQDVLRGAATPAAVVRASYELLRREVIAHERQKEGQDPVLLDPGREVRKIRQKLEKSGTPARAATGTEVLQ